MPRFSINASMMLAHRPFLQRFALAAELGFSAVDIQFPYDHPAPEVASHVRAAGLDVVLINVPVGDFAQGGPALVAVPGGTNAFRDALDTALRYCEALHCTRINILSGCASPGDPIDDMHATLLDNVRLASRVCRSHGVTVMLEPANANDYPGYLMRTTEQALDIITAVDADNVALQFDLYHRQIEQGNLITALTEHLEQIAHIQFADVPGRRAPGSGEINFDRVFAALDELGYAHWVGAEYPTAPGQHDDLGWWQDRWRSASRQSHP